VDVDSIHPATLSGCTRPMGVFARLFAGKATERVAALNALATMAI
jgi:hypothetical protein